MSLIKLSDISTRAPKDLDKTDIKKKTEKMVVELDELQNLLFAEGKHAVLVVIQGMDGSGKDGVIRNVLGNITRVHKWCDDETARKRMNAINDFEKLLEQHNNTHILKFYLHISPEEQHERLSERMKDPAKMWKYNEKDFEEAKLWDIYMQMYEDCFNNCNSPAWTIVPADQNWYKEYIIATQLHQLLTGLNMQFPGMKK